MYGTTNMLENQYTDHVQGNITNSEKNDDINNANDVNTVASQEIGNVGNSGNEDQLTNNNEMPDKNMNELPMINCSMKTKIRSTQKEL